MVTLRTDGTERGDTLLARRVCKRIKSADSRDDVANTALRASGSSTKSLGLNKGASYGASVSISSSGASSTSEFVGFYMSIKREYL